MRFEWDSDLVPNHSEDLEKSFMRDIEYVGGIALPTDAQLALYRAEREAEVAAELQTAKKRRGGFFVKSR